MFLNAIMLAGIGGAVVPLVLHLLNRARYRSVDWGAMMFLHGEDAKQRQSTRLKQWVLLALRMALVALLAVTLARPLVAGRWQALGEDAPVTAVILLDRSGSMGYDENGRSRMDLACDAVQQILRANLRKGDQVAVIEMGGGERPVPHPSPDLQGVAASYASGITTPLSGAANVADALKLAADVFDRAKGTNRELFLVCDRQASSWRGVTDAFAAAWAQRVSLPGPRPRFVVVPVGGEGAENVAVEAVEVTNPPAVKDQPADVEVRVHNFGATARAAMPLVVRADGREVLSTTVNVAAGAVASVRLPVRFGQARSHVITAQIDVAGLKSDDALDCAVDVVDPVSVLLASGDATAAEQGGADAARPSAFRAQSDFLSVALAPFRAANRAGPNVADVQVVPFESVDWAGIDPAKHKVIVLANVPELTDAQALALEQHVYGGGGLLVAPGPLTRVENYNALLYRDGAGILPASLAPPTPPDGSAATTVLGISLSHPVFRFLKGKPDPIPQATIGRYFPLAARSPEAKVLASYASGQPFVLENDIGRGRVLLVTTALDADWGTLPLSNFYLPFVQSAVRYLAGGGMTPRNLAPGEPIVAAFDGPIDGDRARIELPDRTARDVPLIRTAGQAEVRFTGTSEAGVYAVVAKPHDAPERRLFFAVQPPRTESDLTPLTADQWASLSQKLNFHVLDPSRGGIASALANDRSARELWPALLGGVLVLALGEVALARAWSNEGG